MQRRFQARRWLAPLIAAVAFVHVSQAEEPKILFQDPLADQLGGGWTWIRENGGAWRFRDHALEIQVEPGDANTVRNALVRASPDRGQSPFAVEVTVAFSRVPTQQYEQAGITWYHDDKPVFKLVHERVDGEFLIVPGRKACAELAVRLRLVVDGRRWTAQYRTLDAHRFETVAEGDLPPPGRDQISLQAYHGPSDLGQWMRFADFRILGLHSDGR
ncbi:MAG: hypothetical protein FJ297_06840 [Planctomycetes bacterium]|nr:hypothetical protein [Planctomycetota bacterium]